MKTTVRAARGGPRVTIRCTAQDELLSRLVMGAGLVFDAAVPAEELVRGLARVLDVFAPFAGRLRGPRGRPEITVEDGGVPFSASEDGRTQAEVYAALGRRAYAGLLDPIDAAAARRGAAPLFTARVSYLADGAMMLGCAWHHAAGDMASFAALLKAWAAAVRGEPPAAPVVVPDRRAFMAEHVPDRVASPGVRRLGWIESARLASILLLHTRDHRLVRVYFSAEEIERMRAACGPALSVNDVLCAHMLEHIRRADPPPRERTMGIAINLRPRLALPELVLGNWISDLRITSPAEEGTAELAHRLRDGVDHFVDRHLDAHATQRFLDALAPGEWSRCVPLGLDPLRHTLLLSNWSGFGVYDVDFGRGRPAYFTSLTSSPLPWLGGIVDGFGGRGRLFGAYLPEHVAVALAASETLHAHRPAFEPPPLAAHIPIL